MNNRLMIVLLGLTILTAAGPALRATATDPETIINHTKQIVMTPDPPEHGLVQALADILGVSLTILPPMDHAAEFKSRIEAAQKAFSEGTLFSDKAYQGLGEAYKLAAGGKAWQIPEELKAPGHGSIDQARDICVKLLDSALVEYKAGRDIEAVRDLLGFAILVVTPIER